MGEDASEWHRHFTTFFEYLDVQKIRTPKGLDWLSAQYPRLTQNDLMLEMQGIRMMHCTIWTEGVREIVSAQDADVKFIVSDHPVTVYNYALPPDAQGNSYPNEPSIALKGSQTIFPLNRNFCLILTNLEYAQDHSANPCEKRTFAGNYRSSMVRTDALIRTRKLTGEEVIRINRVLKARAKRFIAASKEEWLYPETFGEPWAELRGVFLPPKNDLWHFGGEIYVRYESGEVRYQDAFGRTEKEREFLKKSPPSEPPRSRDLCGCGSGRTFGSCCERKPLRLRPTWAEHSIRERNLMLFTGISKILDLSEDRDWVTVRRQITDEKIRRVYGLYDALWPHETNLLAMLPKPDGTARAIYTGVLHPSAISKCALGLSLYFDELLIQHPFIHPRAYKNEYSPLEHPNLYRQEFLNSIVLLVAIMPLVEQGLITLFPDPCNFDLHLRDLMFEMAKFRSHGVKIDPKEQAGFPVRNLDERGEPGLTLNQRHDLTAVGAAEQITFPVSRYRTILGLGRPFPDRQSLGNPATHLCFRARELRFAHDAFRSEMSQQLFFQHTACLHKQTAINRFVRHAHSRGVGISKLKPCRDLLR
ncbi:MAG TPA: DUF4238 domain-containing protein [Rhizomicrobium sp.]|nr:DUF4238 domain-containing protein [Rhizomicrobium sp.]